MKKNNKKIWLIIIMVMLLPIYVLADDDIYKYIDFKVERKDGEDINSTKVDIYVGTTLDNLEDKTKEFEIQDLKWYICLNTDCSKNEEIEDEAIFEEDKEYVFAIMINPKETININIEDINHAMFNGTIIDEMGGEFSNEDSLMIRTKTFKIPKEEKKETIIEPEEPEKEENTCLLKLNLCCNTFLDISICIWIIAGISIILLITIIVSIIRKKKEDAMYDSL